MAQITKGIADGHRLEVSLIPADVLKSIDQAELYDRLAYFRELTGKASASPDPVLRRGYGQLARAVLQARPRAEIARERAELIAKAAGAPLTAQAAAMRRRAELLAEENPPAPPREDAEPIAKARAARPHATVVYNAAGRALGLVDPGEIRPLPAGKARAATSAARRPGRR